MQHFDDIKDNEIRMLGYDDERPTRRGRWFWYAVGCLIIFAVVLVLVLNLLSKDEEAKQPLVEDEVIETIDPSVAADFLSNTDDRFGAVTLVDDTVVDGINLLLLKPVNATPELHLGPLDTTDRSVVFAALAADIRRDNGGIVGAYVLKGNPLAWGLSKKGYVAIIHGKTAIGVADNSPYFEMATETEGYFFRQYPAVKNHQAVENRPENKSQRKAVCSLDGEIVVIATNDRVLMNDFSAALAHLGVNNAVFLIGSNAYCHYVDQQGVKHLLGDDLLESVKNINYILWRRK